MKIFKSVMRVAIVMSIILTAYLTGIYTAKYRQNQEEDKSTVMTIAVVNADVGVMADGGKKYYASELMAFPDTNFKSSGLTDAMEGVGDGRYAAYILIPENFSASVESINSKPDKTQLTYALHDNLRQDVEIKIVNDIHNFILNLSTNISYMYVDAILKELHEVQDDSLTIMQNDIDDMESIEEVKTEDLIDGVEYAPLETTETEIVYMDLSEYYGNLEQAVSDIEATYSANMETAQTEFALIKDGQTTVDDRVSMLDTALTDVDILTDADGNSVYSGGLESLNGLADKYEYDTERVKNTVKERLGFKEGDEEPEPEPELPDGEERVYISKDDLLEQTDKVIDCLEGTVSGNSIPENNHENETVSGNSIPKKPDSSPKVKEAITELEKLKLHVEEYYTNAIRTINEMPDISELSADAEQIILDEISAPIMEEANLEAENVKTEIAAAQKTLDDYIAAVEDYDAMTYLESDKIAEYESAMSTAVSNMETEIMNQDDLYIQYLSEVRQTADSNIEQLKESLDSSYANTAENIRLTMEDFKENRETINGINVELLGGITQKLPYTRIGTLEYTQAYDFIVQPILYNDDSAHTVNITYTSVIMDRADLVNMLIGITALIAIYVAVQIIHRKFLRDKEKREEDEQWQVE